MRTIAVIMSMYNANFDYAREQIDSILSQESVNLDLYIRNDGSKSDTISMIKEAYESLPNVFIAEGTNIGPAKSFLTSLYSIKNYDYYAFADQDDVWDSDKLKIAINSLKSHRDSLLYFCTKRYIDKDGEFLSKETVNFPYEPDINICCAQSIASGCTLVFVHDLRRHLEKYIPNNMQMHDSWLMIMATIFGKVLTDDNPHISYRLHENNVVGISKQSVISKIKTTLATNRHNNIRSSVLHEIYEKYGDSIQNIEIRNFLKKFAEFDHLKSRVQLFCNKKRYAYSVMHDIIIRTEIILKWF